MGIKISVIEFRCYTPSPETYIILLKSLCFSVRKIMRPYNFCEILTFRVMDSYPPRSDPM
jgi:hypothetical protein